MEEQRLPTVLWRLCVIGGGYMGNSAIPCGVWERIGEGLCWHGGGVLFGMEVVGRVVMTWVVLNMH